MNKLSTHQTAAIIGGTEGIGLATARRLLAAGYEVTVGSRNQQHVDKAQAVLGRQVHGAVVEASDPQSLRAFFGQISPLNHVVITATNRGGIKPLSDITADDIETSVRGKLIPNILSARAARDVLAPNGSITFASAVTALAAIPSTALLAAINGAIASMIRPLAVELKPIRVNAVLPGVIDTDWWDWLPDDARKSMFAETASKTPVGHSGRAEDIADAITFLIGNDFTTGVLLPCDGGLRLAPGE